MFEPWQGGHARVISVTPLHAQLLVYPTILDIIILAG
jgi:hypothetical protein